MSDSARRTQLLVATLRIIGEEGVDAVSHRRVAELAGVSLGSTTYWFRSRQDMLSQAFAHFAQEETEALRTRLEGALDRRASVPDVVDELTAFLLPQLSDQARTVAQYALLLEAVRQPELEPVCRAWTAAWHAVLEDVLAALGAEDARLEAQLLGAMLDGLLINLIATPEPDAEHTVIRPALEAWFSRLALGAR